MTNLAALPHFQTNYALRPLGTDDVAAMVALQADILTELGNQNTHFIIPKLEARFAAFTNAPHIAYGAIAADGSLIAMALIGVPNVLEPALGKESGLVQSVFVHVNHRNQGLLDRLLQDIEAIARQNGIKTLSNRIAADNIASQRAFERNGYKQYGNGKRDLDGTLLILLWKELVPYRPGARLRSLHGKDN